MLKILIPLFLTPLLLSPAMWRHSPLILLALVPLSSATLSPSITPMSMAESLTLDHLSAPLIILTLWVCALTIPVSMPALLKSPLPLSLPFMNLLLILILIPAFSLNNLFSFYVAFESSLIPTLLMILLWGYQPDRLQASFYMMMYTISASLPLLLGIMSLKNSTGNLNMFFLHQMPTMQLSPTLWWTMCLFAFLVKLPLYSLHLWLPKAHVEAPTAGSMILASILLKLGGYGLIRLSSIAPKLMNLTSPPLLSISMVGATITGLICMRQTDLKALIAYSSVAHMGLAIAGISSMSAWGWNGALAMMLAHGLSSPALFSLAGMNNETTSTRSLFLTKGFLTLLPNMCMWWFIAAVANMAGPPTINLLAEILLLTSILSKSPILAPLIFASSFLAAAYSLHLYTATQHGPTPKFLNPSLQTPSSHFTSLLLLLTPLFLLIAKPETISFWTI